MSSVFICLSQRRGINMNLKKTVMILLVPVLLECFAVYFVISKIRRIRRIKAVSEKMTAVLKSKEVHNPFPHRQEGTSTLYILTVEAENGNMYQIMTKGMKIARFKEGQRIKILVPEGAPVFFRKNQLYENMINGNGEGLSQLTDDQKKRLNMYLDSRMKSQYENAIANLDDSKSPVIAGDYCGLVYEAILFSVLSLLMAGFIVYAFCFAAALD